MIDILKNVFTLQPGEGSGLIIMNICFFLLAFGVYRLKRLHYEAEEKEKEN